jgi:hypothetical protein
MYSQYQTSIYGGVGGGGGAVISQNTTSNSNTNHGYIWNGVQWVLPSSSSGGATTTTTTTNTSPNNNNTTVDPRVAEYTEYYHQYKELEKRYQGEPQGTQWAKYNADECSRAAHFFHQNPFGTPPFAIPSPPPPAHFVLGGTTTTTTTPATTSHSTTASTTTTTTNNNNNNDGLKRYFDRCLKQCTDAQQKAWVSQTIQEEITRVVQSGTLHTIDWDSKPILTYHTQQQQQQPHDMKNSYYVPTDSNSNSSSISNQHSYTTTTTTVAAAAAAKRDVSYYGPSHSLTDNQHRGTFISNNNHRYQENTSAKGGGGGGGDTSAPASNNYSYYGPIATMNVPPAATPVASQVFMKWNKNKLVAAAANSSTSPNSIQEQQQQHGKKKVPKQKRKSGTTTTTNDNYYGPIVASTESFGSNTQAHDDGDDDDEEENSSSNDFITLPWYDNKMKKKSRDSSGKRKRENGVAFDEGDQGSSGGFDLTKSAMKKRANRFAGQGGRRGSSTSVNYNETTEQWDRYMGKTTIGGGSKKKLDESDYEKMTIKGTCETLEKAYLRLTAPPRPELVRPQHVLEQHLANLKSERESRPDNGSGHDYLWFCSQLKAIRQDCTVQRIQNAFTVDVYEMHARMALEESDMNEYNQCQTQLKELYVLLDKMGGKVAERGLRNRNEFAAYRLIYYVFLSLGNNKHGGSSEVVNILLKLTNDQKLDPMIKYALAVREACYNDDILDYHAFFILRQRAPTIGVSHLIKRLVSPMRYKALLRICKGYRPMTIAVDFILQELGFAADAEWEFGVQWLRSCGCILSEDDKEILTKDTVVHESKMEEKQSLI